MFDSGNLNDRGFTVAHGLIGPEECRTLASLWPQQDCFRSHVIMQRYGYGQGEYQYFRYPLPDPVERLRQALYPELAGVANRWNEVLGVERRFPPTLKGWLRECHGGGQKRPTPLLLRYRPGDYNCLHRDLYGEHVFPIQVAILLDEPGEAFEGGEFVMTEQRPRMQSRPMVLPLRKGDAAIFAVNVRPMKGVRGDYQVKLIHGVSQLRSGRRRTVGVIFHDAA